MDVNGLCSDVAEGGELCNHFSAVCRMTRSVYTLCGFEKNNPVGFCAVCEIRGNYI